MTYPPQQPEDGWNRQQHEQYPAGPGPQPDPQQHGQPGYDPAQYGQQYYDPQTGQPYYPGQEQQYQQGYGQAQYQYGQEGQQQPNPAQQYADEPYGHEEPPTDQTQSLDNGADHTQVIARQIRPEETPQAASYEGQPDHSDEPVQPFAPAHDPANPNQQYGAPEQPFAPQAPVSASPASGQPYQGPVSASPTSGQPQQGFPPTAQPIYQPHQAPPGVPESPFAVHSAPPAQLPAPISAQPASGQPWAGGVPQFTPKRSRGVPGWVYIVGVVVVVLALALGAVFWFGLPGDTSTAEESPSPSEVTTETEPEVEGGGELISDEDSGLGYLSLPQPWVSTAEVDGFEGLPGFASFTGQQHPSELDTDVVGVIGAGGLDGDRVEYAGTDYLRPAVTELGDAIDASWSDVSDLARAKDPSYEYLRIDGRRAILMTYDVTFTSEVSGETGASVMVAVVDLGDRQAAAFVAQIPGSLVESQLEPAREAVMTMQF